MKICLSLCACLVVVPCLFAISLHDVLSPRQTLNKEAGLGDIWSDCSQPGDIVKIDSVKISPDPPKKGENVNVTASATTSGDITGGKIKFDIKYGIFPLPVPEQELCDLVKQGGLDCPLKAGPHNSTLSVVIPSETPSGHYKGSIKGMDSNGTELFCVEIDTHL